MGKNQVEAEKQDEFQVSRFRRALPQVLATSAKNLILLDLGMTLAFPTIVIPALMHSERELRFNDSQASWFGSIAFICQPIGSIISGTVLEPLGRKRSMLLVNVPHLMGWYLYYYAVSIPVIFLACIMMGLGVGFMEAPVITYVGEISEPSLRGVLTSYSGMFVAVGLIVEFLLGTVYDWNTAALISSFVPIITIVAISQVPETPMWLLSKGRVKDAEKALCWLRGWVPASCVQKELHELIRYSNASKLVLKDKKPKSSTASEKTTTVENGGASEKASEKEKTKLREVYCNPVVTTSDELPIHQNQNQNQDQDQSEQNQSQEEVDKNTDEIGLGDQSKLEITENVNGSVSNNNNNVPVESVKNGTTIGLDGTTEPNGTTFETIPLSDDAVLCVKPERKPTTKELIQDMLRPQMLRPLSLVVAFFIFHNGSGFPAIRPYMVKVFEDLHFPMEPHWATVVVSVIGFVGIIMCTIAVPYLGKRVLTLISLAGCGSMMISLALWSLTHRDLKENEKCWTPFIFFVSYSFSFSFGIAPIPWMILSEIFPFRGRGFASGLAAAISYIMGFFTSKTFLDLERIFGLAGVFCFYGTITFFGILYVYFKLPETEGRSLEDIENLYKSKKVKT